MAPFMHCKQGKPKMASQHDINAENINLIHNPKTCVRENKTVLAPMM
jgi:hypothetical protein